ncbi:MAG: hypothetical protein KatS3mg104_0179 [Phycisphaerae bacterium]|nr:MAG: hypothetical protein KatS3mg104_0179 [Phycisphaerae bacterium]
MSHRVLILTGGKIPYHDYSRSAEIIAAALQAQQHSVTATHQAEAASKPLIV